MRYCRAAGFEWMQIEAEPRGTPVRTQLEDPSASHSTTHENTLSKYRGVPEQEELANAYGCGSHS
jgi:hypothetical protein